MRAVFMLALLAPIAASAQAPQPGEGAVTLPGLRLVRFPDGMPGWQGKGREHAQ
jgi:hypothetical protein